MVDAQRDRVLLPVYGVVYGPTFRTGTPKTNSMRAFPDVATDQLEEGVLSDVAISSCDVATSYFGRTLPRVFCTARGCR